MIQLAWFYFWQFLFPICVVVLEEQFVVDMSAEDLRFPIQDLISRKVLVKASRKPKKEDVKVDHTETPPDNLFAG